MPQRTQHSLIHILLLWTAVLSIIQVGFIIFFFTGGRHTVSQTEAHKMLGQPNTTTLVPTEHGLYLGKGKMLTFQAVDETYNANEDEKRIKWLAKKPDAKPISVDDVLTIKKDGYYFLYLQVTVCSCEKRHTVSLKWNNKVLLQGWINMESCSTGLLGKAEELFAGGILEVTIHPNTAVNTTESVTHLDIIYILKPYVKF